MTILTRESRETAVRVRLDRVVTAEAAGGTPGESRGEAPENRITTGDRFLDHMVTTFARYAGLVLDVEARGDLRHHLVEDVAITIGRALRDEIPSACVRYGHAVVPMDDALAEAAIDVGGRAWFEGRLPSPLYEHFLRSLAHNAEATLHVRIVRGRDRHHIVEAAIKACGLALRTALQPTGAVFSTKGCVSLERDEND